MRFEAGFLGLIAGSGVATILRCGTPDPTAEQMQMARKLHGHEHSHVIAANGTKEGGYLDPTDLDRQLAVLNEAYEPQKISFKSASMELVIEPEWADNCKEEAMKTALQQGTYADLNVYFFPKILCQSGEVVGHDQLIGYSTMPTIASSTEMLLSGVHVRADVVPGGDLEYYDLGASAVHEVGHWLGLFHPFQGGCYGVGDLVDDTPPVIGPRFDCSIPTDSCEGGGMDLMDNYMTYYRDSCMTSFTPGQEARMFSSWSAYREPYKL